MKKILAALLALCCSIAFGATTLPVQLINPVGSSSGQAIISTGASSAPAWSAINAATLGGATFAAPGPIGSTTPGTGAFTALSASSTVSGAGFSTYLAAPPAIGGTTPAAGTFTALSSTTLSKVQAVNTSGQSITGNSSTVTTNWTVSNQVGSAFTASTGTYVAPATGYYLVSFQLMFDLSSPAVNSQTIAYVVVAGSAKVGGNTVIASTSMTKASTQATALIYLTSGQSVTFNAYQNSGATATLDTGAANVYLSVIQMP